MTREISSNASIRTDLLRHATDLALSQGGVVRVDQLSDVGTRTITRWLAQGAFTRRSRSVLALPGIADDLFTRSLAIGHALLDIGALTGPSWAVLHGVLTEPPWDSLDFGLTPWVATPSNVRHEGVEVCRRPITTAETAHGVRTVSMSEAYIDVLRCWPDDADTRHFAYQSGFAWSDQRALAIIEADLAQRPRGRGNRRLRAIRDLMASGARSDAERDLLALMSNHGITEFVVNLPVRAGGQNFVLDFAFRDRMVAIEVDGRVYHEGARFESDRRRRNLLELAGWTVLHITWRMIHEEPEQTIRLILKAIGEA